MVAVEQAQAASSNSSSSSDGSTTTHPHPHIPWELQSFLKLHGDAAASALQWYTQALTRLLPLLAPIDIEAHACTQPAHGAAAQAAAYRACMRSVVQGQLQLLRACTACAS